MDKKVVVLAAQWTNVGMKLANFNPSDEEDENLLEMSIKGMEGLPSCQLLVKLHPGDMRAGVHKRVIEQASARKVQVVQHVDLLDLLTICDVLISPVSTICLEAMIMDKPVILVDFEGKNIIDPFKESGAVLAVRNETELTDALNEVLNSKETREKLRSNREKFVYKYAYLQDGKASSRVAELIRQMVA